jgi:hypothetical protein
MTICGGAGTRAFGFGARGDIPNAEQRRCGSEGPRYKAPYEAGELFFWFFGGDAEGGDLAAAAGDVGEAGGA